MKAGVLNRQHHMICTGFGMHWRGHFAECHSEDDAHKGKNGGLQHTRTCLKLASTAVMLWGKTSLQAKNP